MVAANTIRIINCRGFESVLPSPLLQCTNTSVQRLIQLMQRVWLYISGQVTHFSPKPSAPWGTFAGIIRCFRHGRCGCRGAGT